MAGVASLFFYIVVLVVSVTSVLFGLDWLSTPLPPHAKPPVHVAVSTQAPSPQAQAPRAANAIKSTAPAEAIKQEAQAAPSAPRAPASPAAGTADSVAPASPSGADTAAAAGTVGDAQPDTTATIAPSAAAPRCNVHVCAVAYRSFRASDCTWQPLDGGPRRQCTKGKPQARVSQPKANRAEMATAANQAQARACNVQACQQAYSSFDPADCTYQPYGGPRRYCAK